MKKIYSLILITLAGGSVIAQNSLLQSPTTGQLLSNGRVDDIELVSNGTDVVLVAANAIASEFYAIDIADNNANNAAANTVTTIPNFQALIDAAAGQTNLNIKNFEVNPISKSVYVLAHGTGLNSYLIKIEDNGSTVSLLDYSNMTFSLIDWAGSNNYDDQDMSFGNGTLYITSGNFSLDGEIAWVTAPFTHNTTTTSRATTMFKTNWGSNYFTTAPLERFTFANVNGEDRLLGVTVCAPGFSLKTSDIPGGGVLQVTEDYNINTALPQKVVHQQQDGKDWLFDLHSSANILIRVGEKYLDGSQVTNNNFNTNADYIRDGSGNPSNGMTDDEIKIYTEVYDIIAFWDNWNLLVLEADVLKLFETGVTNGVIELKTPQFSIFPNPTSDVINMSLENVSSNATATVHSIDGKVVLTEMINGSKHQIDVSNLDKGAYLISIQGDGFTTINQKMVIK